MRKKCRFEKYCQVASFCFRQRFFDCFSEEMCCGLLVSHVTLQFSYNFFLQINVPGEGHEDSEDFQTGSSFCGAPKLVLYLAAGLPGQPDSQ